MEFTSSVLTSGLSPYIHPSIQIRNKIHRVIPCSRIKAHTGNVWTETHEAVHAGCGWLMSATIGTVGQGPLWTEQPTRPEEWVKQVCTGAFHFLGKDTFTFITFSEIERYRHIEVSGNRVVVGRGQWIWGADPCDRACPSDYSGRRTFYCS